MSITAEPRISVPLPKKTDPPTMLTIDVGPLLRAKCMCGHNYSAHRRGSETCAMRGCGCKSFRSRDNAVNAARSHLKWYCKDANKNAMNDEHNGTFTTMECDWCKIKGVRMVIHVWYDDVTIVCHQCKRLYERELKAVNAGTSGCDE